MVCTRCGVYTSKPKQFNGGGALCDVCYVNNVNFAKQKAKANGIEIIRKNGDIWKLPSANAPLNAEQWAYQGSGRKPYVVTYHKTKRDGGTTPDGWACSCPSFTQNVPRDHCKHIIKIMAAQNIKPVANIQGLRGMAALSDEAMDAFKKWQIEQAEKAEKKGTATLNHGLMTTGRKFR